MLTINPNEEALLAWPGLDTLVRRVVLRRPEEPLGEWTGSEGAIPNSPARGRLLSQDLTWYRITSRDLPAVGELPRPTAANPRRTPRRPPRQRDPAAARAAGRGSDMHRVPGGRRLARHARDCPGSAATCSKRPRASRSPARTSC